MTDEEETAVIQKAMDDWRIHNDPASDEGPTMAEAVFAALKAAGRFD